jgi:hypothetical protein
MGTSINDLRRLLESVLGFEYESGDHVRYVLRVNGIIIARTKFSHSWRGNQQIDNSILSLQAKQLHCPNPVLKGLLRGSLGKKEYFRELLKGGFIDQVTFDALFGNK